MNTPTIGLTIALAWHCGECAQCRQPPAIAPAIPVESAHPTPTTRLRSGRNETASPPPGSSWLDVPDDWNKHTAYDGRLLSVRLSVVALIDYTAFTQDGDSVSQVGEQTNQGDVRTFRVMSSGQIKTLHPISRVEKTWLESDKDGGVPRHHAKRIVVSYAEVWVGKAPQ